MVAGLVMVTVAAASWGTWSLFLRPTGLPSTITSPIIFAVMAIVALPFALRGPRVVWDRRTVGLLLGNAAFDALNVVTFFGAMAYTTVAVAVLTHYVAPILIALAAPRMDLVARERAHAGATARESAHAGATATHERPLIASLVALAGLVIVLEPWHAPAAGAAIGAALGVASAFCYAGNVFVVRRLADRIGATRAMAYHCVIAAAALAPLAIAGIAALPAGERVTASDIGLLGAGAITIGAASGIVFIVGLMRIGAARAAVLTFVEPLVAVAVGGLVWEERLHPLALVGGALVLGAGIHVARKAR